MINVHSAITKAVKKLNGENVEQFPTGIPHVCNNESLSSVNAAGTGVVSMLKADGSNVVTLPEGATVPAAKTLTVAGALSVTGTATFTTGGVNYAEVSFTSAQVKALRATPGTLVAAPGAGKVLEFVSAVLILDYGTNGFTETADNLTVKYTDGSGVAASQAIEMTGFIDQTADTMTTALAKIDAIAAKTACENKALVLHNIGDGEIAGNAANDNVLRVKVVYRVHSTGW